MLAPADLTSLPKGQAFALLEGGQLYKIRFPLPKKDPHDDIPSHINVIAAQMREKYSLNQVDSDSENAFVEGANYGE